MRTFKEFIETIVGTSYIDKAPKLKGALRKPYGLKIKSILGNPLLSVHPPHPDKKRNRELRYRPLMRKF